MKYRRVWQFKIIDELPFLSRFDVKKILNKHGADRILFGTDSPWSDVGDELNALLDLDISQEAKDKILYKNALKLL